MAGINFTSKLIVDKSFDKYLRVDNKKEIVDYANLIVGLDEFEKLSGQKEITLSAKKTTGKKNIMNIKYGDEIIKVYADKIPDWEAALHIMIMTCFLNNKSMRNAAWKNVFKSFCELLKEERLKNKTKS